MDVTMNTKCTNETCPEYGFIKDAMHIDLDVPIYCGDCWSITERTDEPMPAPEPEVTDDDPTE